MFLHLSVYTNPTLMAVVKQETKQNKLNQRNDLKQEEYWFWLIHCS